MSEPRLVYSDEYDISCWGIERLHPADTRKASRAFAKVKAACVDAVRKLHVPVTQEVSHEALLRVHSEQFLASLRRSSVVAQALEVPALRLLPASVLDRRILRPMRLATEGTLLAARNALTHGSAINFSGGYHHAHRDRAEGFCVFADIPVAIEQLRAEGRLSDDAVVAVVDLDAHRGNGFEAIYEADPRLQFFDIYNFQVYPGLLSHQEQRFPHVMGLRARMDGEGYHNVLRRCLPAFLAELRPALAFYNAGSDILQGDPVGRLSVSFDDARARDRYVISELERAGIAWVMVPSGGYTEQSHGLLADTTVWALQHQPGDSER
ncbi:MAG: hypothetical protein JWN04_1247 [Myxococcaceae bacterium]|nr:hypothetical protein [Myxococcaceae bacterium]